MLIHLTDAEDFNIIEYIDKALKDAQEHFESSEPHQITDNEQSKNITLSD